MLILKLGWRNLWRNPRRSLINISAVGTAMVFLVLLQGMMDGMKDQLLENGTALMSGHAQLHHPGYLPDRSIYDTLGAEKGIPGELFDSLRGQAGVEAEAPRVYGFALLSTGDHSAGAQLMGIQPSLEQRVTTFLRGVSNEHNLEDGEPGALLLGEGLARELRASTGAEVAAMTQAVDGSLGNTLFRVSGVLRTGLPHLDKSLAVVRIRDLQELMVLGENRIHEVALRLTEPLLADQVAASLNAGGILPPDVVAQSWGDLAPQLRDYLSLFGGFYGILIAFVAVFAALGILNTMMMAVFERAREIGTVVSLGMSPSGVVSAILVESFFLTVLGLVLGVVVSALLMQPLTTQGLDLSRWTGELSMMNTRMDPVIRFKWLWGFVGWATVGLLLAGILAAAVPALRAVRMNPVEARSSAAEV